MIQKGRGAPTLRGDTSPASTAESSGPSIPVSLLVSKRTMLSDLLTVALGNRGRAEMAMEGMMLQAYYGSCFASARHLGMRVAMSRRVKDAYRLSSVSADMADPVVRRRVAGAAEKAFDRLLGYLKAQRLVRVTVRVRRHGTLAGTRTTNLIDWSPLWRTLRRLLGAALQARRWRTERSVMSRAWRYLLLRVDSATEAVMWRWPRDWRTGWEIAPGIRAALDNTRPDPIQWQ